MRVGYDIDGVLADFKTACIREAEFYDALPEFPSSPHDWDKYKPEGFEQLFNNVKNSATFWLSLPVLYHAWLHQPFIREHGVCYITARDWKNPDLLKVTETWLAKNGFPNYPVYGAVDKREKVREMELDFFVEDNWQNWMMINSDTDCQCLLLNTPHNENRRVDDPLAWQHLRFANLVHLERHLKTRVVA
jgi:uncharacterized HAD superfamily protein